MSPEQLLVPIVIAAILFAIVVFAVFFLAGTEPEDGEVAEAPEELAPDDSDSWYFVRFEPPEALRDLSHP